MNISSLAKEAIRLGFSRILFEPNEITLFRPGSNYSLLMNEAIKLIYMGE